MILCKMCSTTSVEVYGFAQIGMGARSSLYTVVEGHEVGRAVGQAGSRGTVLVLDLVDELLERLEQELAVVGVLGEKVLLVHLQKTGAWREFHKHGKKTCIIAAVKREREWRRKKVPFSKLM